MNRRNFMRNAAAAVDAYVWEAAAGRLLPVRKVASLPLHLLKGIDSARLTLMENTRRFADGLPANNALLWGARGMGKSSLVKALHGEVNRTRKGDGTSGASFLGPAISICTPRFWERASRCAR